jgi:drug/metabolite transporter (DMT)-like permease
VIAALTRRPALAGAAGALTIAFSAILVKLAEESPSTVAVFRCAYALPVLALLASAERRRFGPREAGALRLSVLAGVLFSADLIFWHYTIEYVGAGLATVLGNLQVVLVGLAAWAVLGEKPASRVFVAVPVMLIGVVLISGVVGEGAYGDDPALGVLFGVLTSIAYAGFILVLRHGNRDVRRPAGPLFEATFFAAIASVLAGWAIGDLDLVPSWPAHGWLALLAPSSQVLGWMLISVSLPRLPAVMTALLLMLQPLGSMVLGIVLLGEDPSAAQIAGAAVILAGIAIATVTRAPSARSSARGPHPDHRDRHPGREQPPSSPPRRPRRTPRWSGPTRPPRS